MAVEAVGMTDQQIEHFYSEGYVVVPDVFDPERDFDPLIADYSELLDEFAGEMLDSGEITHQLRWPSAAAGRRPRRRR